MKFPLYAAALCALIAPTVQAQSQAVKLELKFNPDQKILVKSEEKMQMNQEIEIFGQTQKTDTTVLNQKSVLITTKTTDTGLTRTHAIQDMKSEMGLPQSMKIKFDSKNPDKAEAPPFPGMDQVLEGMKMSAKAKRVYMYDKSNKLVSAKVEGIDVQKLPIAMQAEFDAKNMLKSRQEAAKSLPTKAVKPGDTWTVNSELQVGVGQTLATKVKHTYKGLVSKGDKKYDLIETEVLDVTMKMEGPGLGGITMSDSDVKAKDSKGKIWFDREAGRIVAQESTLNIAGRLTMMAQGQELPVKMDMKLTDKSESLTVR